MARELSAMGLEAIYVGGSPSLRVAMQEIKTTPIVMFTVGDPVASGWVRNLARPEGNVTGVAGFARDLGGKRVSLLRGDRARGTESGGVEQLRQRPIGEIFKDLQERTHSSGVRCGFIGSRILRTSNLPSPSFCANECRAWSIFPIQ